MTRPVAVLLSPVWPRPGGSGRALRAWDWMQELAGGHELHVWTPQAPGSTAGWPAGVRAWAGADDLEPPAPWARRLGWLLPGLGVRRPGMVAHWHLPRAHPPALSAMARAIGGRPVARLVVFRLYLHGVAARLRAGLPVQRAELDLDDWDSATMRSTAGAQWRMGLRLDAALAWRESLQYRALERRVPAGYDARWLAAHEDLPAFPGAGVRPNRLPLPLPARAGAAATGGMQMVFVGSLDYPPNQEAALLLAEGLAPLLRARLAAPWTLHVAGARPPDWLRARLQAAEGVRPWFDVPDVEPVYAACTVALLPVLAGGGTKLKTLEALARGMAVVASAQAVRGLRLVPGLHYLPAETPEQCARAVLRLHAEPPLRAALGAAGRDWYAASQDLTPGPGT
jgi:glycosyltransferase involved in cell wall biosynthesis